VASNQLGEYMSDRPEVPFQRRGMYGSSSLLERGVDRVEKGLDVQWVATGDFDCFAGDESSGIRAQKHGRVHNVIH
jgi:hypothetical protein